MAVSFLWTCPFCNRGATITDSNYSTGYHTFDKNNKDGDLGIYTQIIVCPNKECKEYAINGQLRKREYSNGRWSFVGEPLLTWRLRPRSSAMAFPEYVPKAIVTDYEEACLIRDLSPKASATLSRRCLQGIIRDFWRTKPGRLVDEIEEIKERVDPLVWEAIDSVRKVGNIGAHMEKDINLIVEVEPNEAQLLIELIETLIREWYIAREERKKRLSEIKSMAKEKEQQKKGADHNQQA
jgi:Domain of unknown function (DUF4145)